MSGGLVVLTRGLPLHAAGGMESVAWDVSHALAAGGSAVTVITTAVPGRPAAWALDGVDVRALPGTAPGRYSRAWWSSSRRALEELLRTGSVTGVLSVSAGAFSCLDVTAPAGAPRPRFVLQAHGTSVAELTSKLGSGSALTALSAVRNARALLRDARTYRRFDAVVAVGPAVAASLTSPPLGGLVRMPPVRTVANGVDTSVFRPDPAAAAAVRRELGVPAPARLLLVAGRLHPQKRVDRALRGLRSLTRTRPDLDPHLLVAGGGDDEGRLRALAAELGVGARVRFTGSVPRDRLASLCAAADASLLTSAWREVGLTMTVLESLACGTPALVPLGTAGTEDAGSAVTRVDVADERALAAAVGDVLDRGRTGGSLLPARCELRRVAREYERALRGE
ncbi:glycosyltransferase family 4 protein [Kineococcus auxinigenes]|uniref:glycosyltransferase family 4 protein n=1 Tax=unclassified Kineococcus TaxID=2621656 RepID=UPI003D7E2A08